MLQKTVLSHPVLIVFCRSLPFCLFGCLPSYLTVCVSLCAFVSVCLRICVYVSLPLSLRPCLTLTTPYVRTRRQETS